MRELTLFDFSRSKHQGFDYFFFEDGDLQIGITTTANKTFPLWYSTNEGRRNHPGGKNLNETFAVATRIYNHFRPEKFKL